MQSGLKAVFGFPNRNSYPGFMRNLDWYRVTNLKRFYYRIGFKKLFGSRIDQFLKRIHTIRHRINVFIDSMRMHGDAEIIVSSHVPESLKDALEEALDHEVLSIWKDLPYLRWRYENHPENQYQFHILNYKGRAEGVIITREQEDTIVICDLIHRKKNILQTVFLLKHVLNYYIKSNAQIVEFYGYDNGYYDAVFIKSGFDIVPSSNYVFGGRVFENPKLEKMFILPHNWTIAYGDIDVI
jgi:hypothetical protein